MTPYYDNHDSSYARVERSGTGVTTHWTDAQLFRGRDLLENGIGEPPNILLLE